MTPNSELKRVEHDFYATDPQSVKELLKYETFKGDLLEPCCGQGHISKVLNDLDTTKSLLSTDLIDRGYGRGDVDFLKVNVKQKYDHIVTNPPYLLAQEFIEKSLKVTTGKVAMFLRLQFLEGQARQEFFKRTPLSKVYVFSKRQGAWRNGEEIDLRTGKKWSSPMTFAWFVWDHNFNIDNDPVIRWI